MWDANAYLQGGSSAQRAAISGITDHAFEKHGAELGAIGPREFAASAMRDINTADRVIEFDQAGGKALLFGNTESGTVGWINQSNPEKSTYFVPGDGVSGYIDSVRIDEGKGASRELLSPEIAEIRTGSPIDAASNFHEGLEAGRNESPHSPERDPLEPVEAAHDNSELHSGISNHATQYETDGPSK